MNKMIACYREEAIECVKDHVLQRETKENVEPLNLN